VPLKHQLGRTVARIPKLHAAIFGAAQYPLSVGGQRDAENEVLFTVLELRST
jgi:hypothetical protein